jgi:hypothetical protein
METDEAVLTKIKKLLNMAQHGNHSDEVIEEANTAMAMAQRMLKRHHLSMSQVIAFDNSEEGETNTNFFELKEEEAAKFRANTLPRWMATLVTVVNKVTETKTLIRRVSRPGDSYNDLQIMFVGDVLDVSTGVELFNYFRNTVTKLSSTHTKEIQGKYKQWRSFAEGCSSRLLERAVELENKMNRLFNQSIYDKCSVENFELDENEEWDDLGADFEEFRDQKSLELYGKYQENKYEKIREFINNIDAENEKVSSTTSRIDEISFAKGSEAGEQIPLKISTKLNKGVQTNSKTTKEKGRHVHSGKQR